MYLLDYHWYISFIYRCVEMIIWTRLDRHAEWKLGHQYIDTESLCTFVSHGLAIQSLLRDFIGVPKINQQDIAALWLIKYKLFCMYHGCLWLSGKINCMIMLGLNATTCLLVFVWESSTVHTILKALVCFRKSQQN